MAFVLELHTTSTQHYTKNYLISIIREFGIHSAVRQEKGKIIAIFDDQNPRLQACIEAIGSRLPASFFLTQSTHYEVDATPDALPEYSRDYPLGLGLCPSCHKELFDPSSRRYYYPFTSCSHCGGQYGFLESYPFDRAHTTMRFIQACPECEAEQKSVGIREVHHLNSCHECAIPVALIHKDKTRYANDAGTFRTMFEVAAKALLDGKRVKIKTTLDHKCFYLPEAADDHTIFMLTNPAKITDHISVIETELHALLSIERPVLHVALKDQAALGHTANVKYPDDGFALLLAKELSLLGCELIGYETADETTPADLKMQYDLPLQPQKDLHLFVNKEVKFIAQGERVCFPSTLAPARHTLSVAHDLIGMIEKDHMLFDTMEHFDSVSVDKAVVLETQEQERFHSTQHTMSQDEASFMSVVAEHGLFGTKCVGAYFDETATLLYYDGKKVIRVVPSQTLDSAHLIETITHLREGSGQLIQNIQTNHPDLFHTLQTIEQTPSITLFEATAMLTGLTQTSMEGLTKEALKFVGKGGLQIDTHVKDNRFDPVAFLASILSYRLAGVESTLLSYSIFESFGDYFSELIHEIQGKTKAQTAILCGTHFANPSLFSRMQRNLKQSPPLMNINYPIGRENAVVGGVYL